MLILGKLLVVVLGDEYCAEKFIEEKDFTSSCSCPKLVTVRLCEEELRRLDSVIAELSSDSFCLETSSI